MAGPYYVRSTDGNDADTGLTWALAKATIQGALSVAAAGERIWVSQAHAETQATALTMSSAGTAGAPIEIFCGNDAAEPPTALATTATLTTTGSSSIVFNGFAVFYGITFNMGTGGTSTTVFQFDSTSPWWFCFDTCALYILNTNTGNRIRVGASSNAVDDQRLVLVNSSVKFSATAQGFDLRGPMLWRGGSVASGGSVPTALFRLHANMPARVVVQGVDLSQITSGNALVSPGGGTHYVSIENCKLAAGVSLMSASSPGQGGVVAMMDNCDSADTNYRMQRHQYEGDSYSETTLVRTGGASDGTTGLSDRHVSSANSKFYAPLYGPEMVIWNNAVGSSQTVTCEILHDSVTALTDAEVWLETEYLGTSGFPLSLFASDRAADILATPANQAASSETWTTTGMTNPNTQKLVTTQTPQEKGWYRCRVALAKASYTVYADPKLAVA